MRETCLIEFKKWKGRKGLDDAFDQLVRRYATGNEVLLAIYCLSTNKDFQRVRDQAADVLVDQPEYVKQIDTDPLKVTLGVRGMEIPMQLHLADLYVA